MVNSQKSHFLWDMGLYRPFLVFFYKKKWEKDQISHINQVFFYIKNREKDQFSRWGIPFSRWPIRRCGISCIRPEHRTDSACRRWSRHVPIVKEWGWNFADENFVHKLIGKKQVSSKKTETAKKAQTKCHSKNWALSWKILFPVEFMKSQIATSPRRE